MTQINFTLDFEKIKGQVVESSLNEVIKSAIVLILNEYMEKERDDYMNNQRYDRTKNRHDYRNGYYERELILNIGTINLKVPRTRSGEFSTEIFEKYQRCDQALLLSMTEMVINGVSTRKVTNIVKQLCGKSVSKSFVSNLTKKLDPIVNEWANRPLNTTNYRYLFLDAMYIKVREYDKVVSKAVYIALGVNDEGKREIIGLKISQAESKKNWSDFFDYLISRGLKSPRIVISDAHQGLRAAIEEKFVGSTWQRCTVHFIKNIIDAMPKKDSEDARNLAKSIFRSPNSKIARELKEEFIKTYEDNGKYQKAIERLDDGFEDAIQFFAEPENAHKHIKTTNVLERINSEVRRRERVIRIFPNQQSAFRLIGSVLMDYEETLDQGIRKYIHF
ncbi:MAG TPA: IS256 family transposase [Cerasibacillus sp.]|uniref:IS256 family transposase n=1 Tax=Cerasibacillus sp. TaxID=2498711 RepID=UPI002F3E2371